MVEIPVEVFKQGENRSVGKVQLPFRKNTST